MGFCVCNSALLQCSFGAAPSTLIVTPENKTVTSGMPVATIMDYVPMKNIMPFGMCNSTANPQVIAATAAKLGVFSPMPCVPAIVAPWVPGCPTVLISNKPALNKDSVVMCLWAGVIQIKNSGTTKVVVP